MNKPLLNAPKLAAVLILLFITHFSYGQITYVGCSNTFLTKQSTTVGADGHTRNTYVNGDVKIIWNVGQARWEIIKDFPFIPTAFYNDTASYPNPPDLTLGNWVKTGNICGALLTTLTGDVQSTIVWSDITPPLFENSKPVASSIHQKSFTLETDIDEAGTIYYVVLADGATGPTSAEVKVGTGTGGSIQVTSGNTVVNTRDNSHNFNVTGLTAGTAYDVYTVAQDDESIPNIQTSPIKIKITTAANTLPTFTSTPVIAINEGSTYTYNITTNDVDGDAVAVTATTKPSWLSFSAATTTVSSLAFSTGISQRERIRRQSLRGVSADASGNVYVVVAKPSHKIYKISPSGVVTTLAGSTGGFANGTGTAAQFSSPSGLAVDASGNVYVADMGNHRIRKISPSGVVTTLAGSTQGFAEGTGTAAQFDSPYGVSVDVLGNVYVADSGNHKIRKISPSGVVTTLAGSASGFANGRGTAAQFSSPYGVSVDALGNVYVADSDNHKIRKISPSGVVTTLAGSTFGFANGIGVAAQFNSPYGVSVDTSGNVYVADSNNNRIRKITPSGLVSALADITSSINAVCVGASGTVYVADNNSDKIRKIAESALLRGDSTGKTGVHNVVLKADDGSGGITNQSFTITVKEIPTVTTAAATTITVNGATVNGNVTANGGATITERGFVYALTSDDSSPTLAEVNSTTVIKEVIAGTTGGFTKALTGLIANSNYSVIAFATNSVGVTESSVIFFTTINTPPTFTSTAITAINEGSTYTYNITTNDVDGDAVTVTATTKPDWLSLSAVTTTVSSLSFSTGLNIRDLIRNVPLRGVSVDASGNVYVAVARPSHKIYKINPSGVVTTLAGSTEGFVNGTGTSAQFSSPSGLAVDASGNVYVADFGNHRIRKISPSGVVTTLAGSTQGFAEGTGTVAQFDSPYGVSVDALGNVYVADSGNHKIRKISPSGVVTTLAGSTSGFAEGTGIAAQFDSPYGVSVDALGNIYVADSGNHKIRKISPSGVVSTLAGSTSGFANGIGAAAQFDSPKAVSVDTSGNVYIGNRNIIRKITPSGLVNTLAGSTRGFEDGLATVAKFKEIKGVYVDVSGTVYVADSDNDKIRKITQRAVITGDATGKTGVHNVVLKAADGNGGITNQSFTITVKGKPTVTTAAATTITENGATVNGNVTANGGTTIIERGFVYALTSDDNSPTLAEVNGTTVFKVVVTGTTGVFTKALTGLIANSNYSVIAFATNSVGVTEATVLTFTTINTQPFISSITRQSPTTSPTDADALAWDITFDRAVVNVDATDFTVSGTTATIASVTNPSGNVYRVTASGGDLAGLNATVTLGFAGGQNIADGIGNSLTNLTPTGTNNNTFIVNNAPPMATWTGALNTDWAQSLNWNPTVIPTANADITIPSGLMMYPTANASVTFNSLTINSGASFIPNSTTTGTVTYKRNLPTTGDWYLVSTPIANETLQNVIANNTFATGSTPGNIGIGLYENSNASQWAYVNAGSTGNVTPGMGISAQLATAGDISSTGTALNTSNVIFGVSTGTTTNFNLLGNPFTAFINSATFTTTNTAVLTEETVWLWNGTAYVTYNNASPIEVAPGQAFFVEASTGGAVIFTTANRSHQNADTFMREAPKSTFELSVEEGTNKSATKVFYADSKTTGFDNGYDSKMFGGTDYKFKVYTELVSDSKGKKLAIQTLPNQNLEKIVIPVGLIAEAGKKITFSVKAQNLPDNTNVFLEDRINNTLVNISEENHSVTLKSTAKGTGQFYIHTSAKNLEDVDIAQDLESVSIYKSANNSLTIAGLQADKASVNVYSILGKKVISTELKSTGVHVIQLPKTAAGVYIVELSSSLGTVSKKIILE
ncbi:hypothetical protein CXF68_05795 [Tenacibaculum sp. Bg11-29]|uniref:T9SS type A sorting domain-containing protein n=1 Tax=Tenacibaculum sp. Bg11-29 TaxID=2058306 RepID=UPI000C34E35F|nr:T9SS type A sorting domain-containing protein [Tenacibaculum sp. Bg11-29]PKH50241.1 hypothetical protein CXF68_05795 [Tenacibaculum sp. Bg11-29]